MHFYIDELHKKCEGAEGGGLDRGMWAPISLCHPPSGCTLSALHPSSSAGPELWVMGAIIES